MLLSMLSVAMMLPALVDAAVYDADWEVFTMSAGFTLFVGITLILTTRTNANLLNVRQAFILTALSWVVLSGFGALPLMFSDLQLSYTDAYFEAMSALSTTGSTVIVGLDNAPPGILLWRSILQWLGGIGVVVMAVSVLPILQVGGMQIFRMEFAERIEKALPRAAQIGAWISIIYVTLTAACALLYVWAGMSGFDAVNHAMTTVATGGHSTHDASLGVFDDPWIEIIATAFMILGSLPFLLYFQAVRGDWRPLVSDNQVRGFFVILGAATLLVMINVMQQHDLSMWLALRHAVFNVTSIMTGTGYATTDYSAWGTFANPLFFVVMFIGGCAGSTTCGIKIFRVQVLFETTLVQLKRLLRPHGVFIAYYNRKPIPESVSESVMAFFFLFGVIFAILATVLGVLGLDFITATSSAATALANVGPGLGPIVGPSGNFASLPDAAKWVMAVGMLLGRLEIFTVLVLLTPTFWKN
ncbi:TrkH family potassium uptake protein [Aestuariispira ectoiniformans]|uniref:TrkH family potassium uptake protein n=1 Tax=Aestuariispira ectoiniformans TaxID=2775080 RepID=UPI00223B9072|nr:TrkH family potassium uptake protein [Aestuariispira ectoiniformans]